MRYIGIDPSFTRTGLCVYDKGFCIFKSITTDKKDSIFLRQKHIVNRICTELQKHDIVTLEEFGISARFAPSGKFCERIELCGMLKLCIPIKTKLPWLSITPTMLKSFATGKASSHKDEVLQSILQRWNVEPSNNDEADAFILAKYTESVFHSNNSDAVKVRKFLSFSDNLSKIQKIKFQIF